MGRVIGVRRLLGPVIARRIEAAGPVDASVAWDRYDRLDLWPTWSPQLRGVTTEGDATRRLGIGLEGHMHGPVGLRAAFTVLSVDVAQRSWSWRVTAGPIAVQLQHGVERRPGGGSLTWLVIRGPAPVVLGYAPPAWYALHRLVTLPPSAAPPFG